MAGETLLLALGGLVAVLALAGGFFLWRRRASAPQPPAHDDEGPPVLEHDVLHLRCGECGTTFDVVETGERPLAHVCPGCGRKGVLTEAP